KRPSRVAAAQQTSLRVSATDSLTGARRPPETAYDEAAALPSVPPKASVTITAPSAKSKPYGVAPEDAIVVGPSASPSPPIANELIAFVPRSVTTRVRPSGLNETCAGSAPSPRARVEPAIGVGPWPSSWNPLMFGLPLLRTYAMSPWTATLVGVLPPDATVASSRSRSGSTANTDSSSLPVFVTSRGDPSALSANPLRHGKVRVR